MALDTEIKAQLAQYLELLENDVVFAAAHTAGAFCV